MRLLIAAGADISVQNSDGSALTLSAMNGHEETVKMLLSAGADLNV
jgi:ankyrin repeat protein